MKSYERFHKIEMKGESANVTIAIEKTEVGFTHMIHSSVSIVFSGDLAK